MAETHFPRTIRSYVLRQGRLTTGQDRAFAMHWDRFGIAASPRSLLDFPEIFGNLNPVWLEIGFGDGESLLRMALDHPEKNFLGVEVHRPGVGHLLIRLAESDVQNVRIVCSDAMDLLRRRIPPASVERILVFFPDPWPKKRHHKRRIVQPELVELAGRALSTRGALHLATDWEEYARHMLATLSASPLFENATGAGNFVLPPPPRPDTKFEHRGRRLGHGVWDLIFLRR